MSGMGKHNMVTVVVGDNALIEFFSLTSAIGLKSKIDCR